MLNMGKIINSKSIKDDSNINVNDISANDNIVSNIVNENDTDLDNSDVSEYGNINYSIKTSSEKIDSIFNDRFNYCVYDEVVPESDINSYMLGDRVTIDEVMKFVHILNNMRTKDVMHIYINSSLGSDIEDNQKLRTSDIRLCSMLIGAIDKCKGTVVTYNYGICAYLSAIIWSAGNQCVISDDAVVIFKHFKNIDHDNGNEVDTQIVLDYYTYLLQILPMYKKYITDDEFNKLATTMTNDSIIISGVAMNNRLKKIESDTEFNNSVDKNSTSNADKIIITANIDTTSNKGGRSEK